MRLHDDLPQTLFDFLRVVLMRIFLDIVDTEQDDRVRDSALREYVGVETRERVCTEERIAQQNAISGNARIEHAEPSAGRQREQTRGQEIRPAVVGVLFSTSTVGN